MKSPSILESAPINNDNNSNNNNNTIMMRV